MKALKIILGTLFGLIFFIGLALVIVHVIVSDPKNAAPVELYDEALTLEEFKTAQKENIAGQLQLDDVNQFKIALTEDDMNRLIYLLIREQNPAYNPVTGKTKAEKYALDLGKHQFGVLGERVVYLRSLYVRYDEAGITFHAPLKIAALKTKLTIRLAFVDTPEALAIRLTSIKLGGLKAFKEGNKYYEKIRALVGKQEAKINAELAKTGMPFTFDGKTTSLIIDKSILEDKIQEVVAKEATPEYKDMYREFITVLLNRENNVASFGMLADKAFGVGFNLEKFRASQPPLVADKGLDDFALATYAKTRAQTFVIDQLAGKAGILEFTNDDLAKMIYEKSHQYADFGKSFDIVPGQPFAFQITGLYFDLHPLLSTIYLDFNMNGLKSRAVMNCRVEGEGTSRLKLVFPPTVTLGEDPGEAREEYIIAASSLVTMLFGQSLEDIGFINFEEAEQGIVFDANLITQMMKTGAGEPPLAFDKLRLVEGGIAAEVTVLDAALATKIAQAKVVVNAALNAELIDPASFGTTAEQQAILQDLKAAATTIGDSAATNEAKMAALVAFNDAYNDLNNANKDKLADDITAATADDASLTALYNELYGN